MNIIRNLILALTASLLMAGCVSSLVSTQEMAAQKAIYDKQTAEIVAGEGARVIDHNLSGITPADIDAEGYVNMVAWKGGQAARDYYKPAGSMDTLKSKYLTWVTKRSQFRAMIDELKIDRLQGQRLALRLEQLLGLPPAGDTTRVFVEMRIKPSDLFRPCRDPEVDDCACALTFPVGAYSPENAAYRPVFDGIITSTAGYPWTRMGYTLDWSEKSRTHFGMSEYVIRQGAIVQIVSKTATAAWVAGE